MKKRTSDPKNVVAKSVAGSGRAHADLVRVEADLLLVARVDASPEHCRRSRYGARAAARGCRDA